MLIKVLLGVWVVPLLALGFNPSDWEVANVIFLESPAGVGYSYDPTGVYVTNDTKTTEDNYLAVLDFFEKFPEFKENEFYITGESYAGVYIPLLARRFLHDSRGVNLKMKKTNSASPNCYNQDHLLLYYNRRDVIEALHVEESPLRWVPCTDTLNYTQQYETVREVVRELIDSDRLRALIYNGDVDMACPFLSNGWFVRSLGVTVIY
ncbi:hypothetical protein V5799_022098 [Amblyomma americanum]|uniref:Carboxypeptidase n=1 Tax=Amblyomma americanum TaxID=6943 RepID=A0AAQ4FMZ8_AMBAM